MPWSTTAAPNHCYADCCKVPMGKRYIWGHGRLKCWIMKRSTVVSLTTHNLLYWNHCKSMNPTCAIPKTTRTLLTLLMKLLQVTTRNKTTIYNNTQILFFYRDEEQLFCISLSLFQERNDAIWIITSNLFTITVSCYFAACGQPGLEGWERDEGTFSRRGSCVSLPM